jgi:hypothetical protein
MEAGGDEFWRHRYSQEGRHRDDRDVLVLPDFLHAAVIDAGIRRSEHDHRSLRRRESFMSISERGGDQILVVLQGVAVLIALVILQLTSVFVLPGAIAANVDERSVGVRAAPVLVPRRCKA